MEKCEQRPGSRGCSECAECTSKDSAVSVGYGAVHLVSATWGSEGCADVLAFHDRQKAEAFAAECDAYQKLEPEDDNREWLKNHPAYPYLNGDTLTGVDSFTVSEIMVI